MRITDYVIMILPSVKVSAFYRDISEIEIFMILDSYRIVWSRMDTTLKANTLVSVIELDSVDYLAGNQAECR